MKVTNTRPANLPENIPPAMKYVCWRCEGMGGVVEKGRDHYEVEDIHTCGLCNGYGGWDTEKEMIGKVDRQENSESYWNELNRLYQLGGN